jgi:2-dehydropantoate 2-reductase
MTAVCALLPAGSTLSGQSGRSYATATRGAPSSPIHARATPVILWLAADASEAFKAMVAGRGFIYSAPWRDYSVLRRNTWVQVPCGCAVTADCIDEAKLPEETAMRIAVMGSGGIGGYLGARLAQAGEDVIFIARGSHLEAMQQKGLRVESPLGEILLPQVSATDTPADVGFVDVVVFAVKAYDTESAAAAIVPLVGPATRVVTLQNGIDTVDAVARIVPRSQVVGGTTYLAALIERPGVIVHLGSVTRVIVGGRDDAMIKAWRSACVRTGGIDLETVDDIDQMLWTKFATVSAFSGATSLIRADVGRIFSDAHARIFLEQLRDEGMAVASAAGHPMAEGYKEPSFRSGESFHQRHARRWPTISNVANRSSCHGCPVGCTCSATNLSCRRPGTLRFIAHCTCTPMAVSLRV